MTGSPIPALDPAPLPGPPGLLQVLWLLTFLLHLGFTNVVLGGSILAAVARRGPAGRETTAWLVHANSWAIALAITFGVAPLLFTQAILGRFFYTATILVAGWWLGMLGLLTAGYYLNYVANFRLRAGKGARAVLILEALCFLAIAAIQVVVGLLHMQPGEWGAAAASPWRVLADPSFAPRWLHFVLAAVSMSAALVAWVAVRRAATVADARTCGAMARTGLQTALYATVAQVVVGFWLVFALPPEVLRGFMRGGPTTMVPLTLAILAGLLLVVLLARIQEPLREPARVRRVLELIVGAMAVMVLTRQQIRGFHLAPARAAERLVVSPQWGPFALFLGVLVLCAGLTVYALVRVAKDRPARGEKAA